jgi:hypothetical protein
MIKDWKKKFATIFTKSQALKDRQNIFLHSRITRITSVLKSLLIIHS